MKENKLWSRTVNARRSSKNFAGYNKVINKKLNEKLLNNYPNYFCLSYWKMRFYGY